MLHITVRGSASYVCSVDDEAYVVDPLARPFI